MHISWICVFICWMVAVTTPGTRSNAIDVPEQIREKTTLEDDNNMENESAGEENPLICIKCSGDLNTTEGKKCGGNENLTTIECYGEKAMCFDDVSKPNHISRGCLNDCSRISKENRLVTCCDEPNCNNKSHKELFKIPVYRARVAPLQADREDTPATAATKSTDAGGATEASTSDKMTTGKMTTKKNMGNNLAATALMLLTASIVGIVAPVHLM